MKMITDDLFIVESVIAKKKKGNIEFKIDGDYIIPIVLGNEMKPISTQEVNNFRLAIFKGITNSGVGGGAFKLDDVDQWLRNRNIYSTYKGKSGNKQDLSLINLDLRREDSFKLGYSVKSQLGSPATILNASSQTNFKYKIKGLNVHELEQVNEINTIKDEYQEINHIKYSVDFVNKELGIDLSIEIDKLIKQGEKPSVIAQIKKLRDQVIKDNEYREMMKNKKMDQER